MRRRELIREIVASARAQWVPTIMVALLAAAMCVTTLLTVGRTAAAEKQVAARLESAGSRLLVVRDAKNSNFLTVDIVKIAETFPTVERVVGLTAAQDTVSGRVGYGGVRMPMWMLVGEISSAVELVEGRWPAPGEALVSRKAMESFGMDHPVGFIESANNGVQFAVVGRFEAKAPFQDQSEGVIVAAPESTTAYSLNVVVVSPDAAAITQAAVVQLLNRADSNELVIQSPTTLAQLQQEVLGDVGEYGRGLLIVVLAGGALLTGIVVGADVLLRRGDLGRRRALGAPRLVITVLVAGRALLSSFVGACTATFVSLAVLAVKDQHPSWEFSTGTVILASLTAMAAALPPAIMASYQDPVRVLRTP